MYGVVVLVFSFKVFMFIDGMLIFDFCRFRRIFCDCGFVLIVFEIWLLRLVRVSGDSVDRFGVLMVRLLCSVFIVCVRFVILRFFVIVLLVREIERGFIIVLLLLLIRFRFIEMGWLFSDVEDVI